MLSWLTSHTVKIGIHVMWYLFFSLDKEGRFLDYIAIGLCEMSAFLQLLIDILLL